MKISVDDKELYTLSEVQKKVIKHEIPEKIFDADMKRRLHWVLNHKYDVCFENFKKEWDPKLAANGVQMIPTDPDAYAQLVFSQPNYQDRAARDAQAGSMAPKVD
jgi:hypothetical protein